MKSTEKYDHEREYWDTQTSGILKNSSFDYNRPDLLTFEELSKTFHYFRPIVDLLEPIAGKKILDLGCGDGWISLSLAKSGAYVYGCDISPNLTEIANRYAASNGLNIRAHFETMLAEEVSYEDNSFDFVIMHAALHHCDIERTVKQVHRVLKPGGKAVFIEDYAYHPLLRLYRFLTPSKHTKTEKALTDDDLKAIASNFTSHNYKYYGILNLFDTASNPLLLKMRPFLKSIDDYLYTHFPSIHKYSKLVEVFVVK